jgi:hypothetical protein
VEIALKLIGAGIVLTFAALVFRNPSGTAQIFNAGAKGYSTIFGTFLNNSSGISAPSAP